MLPTISGGLVDLSPIYRYLTALKCEVKGEHIIIGSWPVQFLPPSSALEKEALDEAVQTEIENTPAWVMTAEHLLSIALQTGRPKDYARILQFLEQDAVDAEKINEIILRHSLITKWKKFKKRYLDE